MVSEFLLMMIPFASSFLLGCMARLAGSHETPICELARKKEKRGKLRLLPSCTLIASVLSGVLEKIIWRLQCSALAEYVCAQIRGSHSGVGCTMSILQRCFA